jgi:hypothetical protein
LRAGRNHRWQPVHDKGRVDERQIGCLYDFIIAAYANLLRGGSYISFNCFCTIEALAGI